MKRMIALFVVGFILMFMLSCGKTNLDPPAGTLSTTTTDNSGVFSDTSSHLLLSFHCKTLVSEYLPYIRADYRQSDTTFVRNGRA